ncbi:Flocculation protein [Actinidia chinensis var. chinensis]|uniref:Flocculation protein n=1 Tax=Actinidia chinensis var. chinensis TaxID=1590841 RepID=A0A2R6P6S1_ACTCC|nr:Flocculation protein [Actinidia chinensis var. chinensis]
MGILGESWCFCNGGGKSERTKAAIFSGKGPAMARISGGGGMSGTGFLIHRNLMLTTHVNLPSVVAAEAAEIRLQNGVAASLFPHRFFITSSVLDLTIVGVDAMDGDSNAQGQQPHYLKTCFKPNLELGTVVYLLGYTERNELTVGEGKVVIATDNLIKLSTDGVTWSPGSAGFDVQGNLAFMVCDPMKLATSPNTKSSSTSSSSSSSWKKDLPMQFGIPIPIICDWLNQHWEGNLDDLNKPKLPLIRLMSAGQKSDHSCASFTMRRVFKSIEPENDGTPSSSNMMSKTNDKPGPSCSAMAHTCDDETLTTDPHAPTHVQGIPTPEIYESPKLTSVPVKKENTQIQLLDINFLPKVDKPPVFSQSTKTPAPYSDENYVKELPLQQPLLREEGCSHRGQSGPMALTDTDIASTGSVNGAQSEVQSSSSPIEISEMQNGYSSEGETTMYSAETAESRNYPSPREGKFQQVGRSQSCVNYNRWGAVQRNPMARTAAVENQRSFMQGRKIYSQGATSQRSNDYFSPTVASIMKKRNEQQNRPRQNGVHSSPRWMF